MVTAMIKAIYVGWLLGGKDDSAVFDYANGIPDIRDDALVQGAKKRVLPSGAWLSEVTVFDKDYNPRTIVNNRIINRKLWGELAEAGSV